MSQENEYNSLKEFLMEYDENDYGIYVRKYMGIEFIYKGNLYRMCIEPFQKEKLPIINKERYTICTYKGIEDNFGSIWCLGWYKDLDDCLDNWYISGVKFRDIISSPETRIYGKD